MRKKIIKGKLTALTGIHIGTGDPTATTDSPIFRNVDGEIIIPGTGIGGVLRSLASRIAPHLGFDKCVAFDSRSQKFCSCIVCQLFGSISPDSEIESDEEIGNASRIWIYNAKLLTDPIISIRDGVGIERETRASSRIAQAKYDYEIITKGSEFTFRIDLEEDVSPDCELLLAAVLTELINGRAAFGGNTSRGLGNIQLEALKIYDLDFSSDDKIINFLKEDSEEQCAIEDNEWFNTLKNNIKEKVKYADDSDLYSSFCQLNLNIKFLGGFVINDIVTSIKTGYDFCSKLENKLCVLPGSGFRGVLRSHAEKIMRSLTFYKVKNMNEYKIRCPACDPNTVDKGSPLASCDAFFVDNRKSVDQEISDEELCLACRLFGSSFKGSRMFVRDGYQTNEISIKIRDFVAIDRFTGGGKEGAKFNALVLWQPEFEIKMLLENPQKWELGLLMLLLRDLKEGFIQVGYGQNKWFGKLETTNIGLKLGSISPNIIPDDLLSNNYEGIFKVGEVTFDDLITNHNNIINGWIEALHKQLDSFNRLSKCQLSTDTYFGTDSERNYPKEGEL